MSLPKPDLHVRLSPEAMRALRFLAECEGGDVARIAARLLEAQLLGAGHAIKCAARRALLADVERDSQGS